MTASNRIRLLAAFSVAVTVVAGALNGWGDPAWYAVPLLAVVVGATETAVAHLSFGRHRWTFSLTEAAIAVAFLHSPKSWTVLAVAAGVVIAQMVRGQELLKL